MSRCLKYPRSSGYSNSYEFHKSLREISCGALAVTFWKIQAEIKPKCQHLTTDTIMTDFRNRQSENLPIRGEIV